MLTLGDFDGALKEFKTAARMDRDNEQYAQEYALLRQVMKLRKACAKEKNEESWAQYAGALRSYYYAHGLYLEALPWTCSALAGCSRRSRLPCWRRRS